MYQVKQVFRPACRSRLASVKPVSLVTMYQVTQVFLASFKVIVVVIMYQGEHFLLASIKHVPLVTIYQVANDFSTAQSSQLVSVEVVRVGTLSRGEPY